MKQTFSTSQVAQIIGIHPNTVRLYEELQLITPPERKANGYRIFTDLHIRQFRIARLALRVEVLQNGLRKRPSASPGICWRRFPLPPASVRSPERKPRNVWG